MVSIGLTTRASPPADGELFIDEGIKWLMAKKI